MEQTAIISERKQERNSAFEILRLFAILFIIAHHFATHGSFNFGALEQTSTVIFNGAWIDFIRQLGKIGVNLFILISSFFLIDNTRFKTKKFIAFLLEMLTFSIVIGVTFFFINKSTFDWEWLKSLLMPFGSSSWWFMTNYLLLYLFSPLLNRGIKALNKQAHLILTITFLVIWSLIPTLLQRDYAFTNLGWFITLYLIGSYIKIYDVTLNMKSWAGILLSVGIFVSWFLIKFVFNHYYKGGNYFLTRILYWFDLYVMNNSVQVVATVILFIAFKNIKMRNIKPINFVAATCLASYLFHDHGNIRHYLWIDLFKNATWSSSVYLFIYSLGVIFAVFLVGIIIGIVYRYTFGLGYNALLNLLDRKCLYRIDNAFNKPKEETEVNSID